MTYEEACRSMTRNALGIASMDEVTPEVWGAALMKIDTPRQRSKFRNGYGRVALFAGRNARPQPKAKAA